MYYFCTSFSEEQYKLFGKDMLESFQRHKTADMRMIAVTPAQLAEDVDLKRFLARYGKHDFAHGRLADGKINYRYQAVKFAHKVFAYTEPRVELGNDDWWIWVDADTKFTAEITDDWLKRVCPDGYQGSYIGRKDWDHSECGWMAFSIKYHGREFLAKMRSIYTSGLLFGFPQWHDSYIFDVVRRSMEIRHMQRWYNLAEDIGGMHPWPETVLGEVMEHFKGPEAKLERFGEIA